MTKTNVPDKRDPHAFFELDEPNFWGDYGAALASGEHGWPEERRDGKLLLYRAGPFMPPITIVGEYIVVTDNFKNALSTRWPWLQFQAVIKEKIVNVNWHEWNRQAVEPEMYPLGGEPENYIEAAEHSDEAAEQLGDVWELVLHVGAEGWMEPVEFPRYRLHVKTDTWDGSDWLWVAAGKARLLVVTQGARDWLAKEAGEWVTFKTAAADGE